MVDAVRQDPIDEYAELLRNVELFAGLDRVTLSKLAGRLELLPIERGTTLIEQGDEPGDFDLVTRGDFGIYVASEPGGEGRRLAAVKRGDPIGEMALLTGESLSATVRAESDGEVLRLARGDFLGLVQRERRVVLAIAATLSRRPRAGEVIWLGSRPHAPAGVEEVDDADEVDDTVPLAPGHHPGPRGWIYRRLRPGRSLLGLALAGLVLALGWSLPPPPGLSSTGLHALGSVGALVALLVLEAMPDGPVTLALGPVATGAGIDPWVIAIVALVACNAFFLPYQSTIYLALYHGTGGRLFAHAQARPLALAYALLAMVGLCASVPVWHLMGLL